MNWGTIEASVVTALLTTAAVEYLAKPRLEARKERILSQLRARRELNGKLLDVLFSAKMVLESAPTDADQHLVDAVAEEQARQYERLTALAREMFDGARWTLGLYNDPIQHDLALYLRSIFGITRSSRSRERQAELILELTAALGWILKPKWRPLRLVDAQTKFRELVKDLEKA